MSLEFQPRMHTGKAQRVALPGLLSLNEVMRGPVAWDPVSPTDRERRETQKAGNIAHKRDREGVRWMKSLDYLKTGNNTV